SETDAEKKIKALEKWLFGGGSNEDEGIILDEEGNWWVNQFDETFKTPCGCWPTNDCNGRKIGGNQCCYRAANMILDNASSGMSTNRSMQLVIAESSSSDCGSLTGKATEFEQAVKIIDKSLFEHELPILIGVHHPKSIKNDKGVIIDWEDKCSNNTPSTTNYYVVIRGKKYDETKKQYYYLFYEVGTSTSSNGESSENRLYIDTKSNLIKGKTAYITTHSGDYYIVTEVRKNTGQTY
ncbi:hypothetical protein MK137Hg34_000313800, partial [Viscerimonas tarda]